VEILKIEGSANVPYVRCNPENGEISIKGRSIPEHPANFYEPIHNWIKKFAKTNPPKLNLTIYLDYLNTHSTECILVIFKILESDYKNTDIQVNWLFDEGDEDMEELGENLSEMVDIPFKTKEKLED